MGIRLLGPVELRASDGSLAEVAGAQRRAVLSLLALELGRTVPVERFFELLWGDEPPAQARAALQGHVAALRKVLGDTPFTLHTRAPGYLLTGAAEQVDVRLFEELTDRAEAADDDAEAAEALQRALGLWGGAALADLPDTELRRALVGQLEEARIRALSAWAERRLRLGNATAAIPALEQSVRADGLREPTVALLIRCLHQAGRASDALAAYHHARERLADELGVTPGPVLREALAEVLGGPSAAPATPDVRAAGPAPRHAAAGSRQSGWVDPAARPAATTPQHPMPQAVLPGPRQLPRQSAGFVGRARESHWLDQECGADRLGDGLAVVIGPAGAGKTATVIRWAHAAAPGFPDGQLFTDLRGFDPVGPADQAEVLGHFLRALGLPESAIPEDATARAKLYRAETEHRRLLVVLDNARGAGDVTDLLPTGPDCATVITSRNSLEDLVVTEGAALLRLEALPQQDALGLLERMLTPARVEAEPGAARRLIGLCDQLPLALRIAAARLTSRPGWTITDLVTELTDERTRLRALDTRGAFSVRTALSLTYRHLSREAARLITMLAAHPGREVDAYAGAALLGCEVRDARHALGELATYHLLTESTPGRYTRHDLIRLFGMELYAEQSEEVRRVSTARLLDYYLAATRQSADRLEPGSREAQFLVHPPLCLPQLSDVRSALAWFHAEEPTIRTLVASAGTGDPERAWRLAELCTGLYYGAGHLTDWLSCLRSGLMAAGRLDSPAAVALLQTACANALVSVLRPQEALGLARQAVANSTPADGGVHSLALATLGLVTAVAETPVAAAPAAEAAVALARSSGQPGLVARVLAFAAFVKELAGDAGTSLRYAREARRLLGDHPDATMQLWATVVEALALQRLGQHVASELLWTQALTRCRDAGFLHLNAVSEQQFAEFLLELGRAEDAAEHLRSAIDLYELRGYRMLQEDMTARLLSIESGRDG